MIARRDVVAGKILDRNHGCPRLQDAEFKAKVKKCFLVGAAFQSVFYDDTNYVPVPARGNDAATTREATNPTDFKPGIWLVLKGTTILREQV